MSRARAYNGELFGFSAFGSTAETFSAYIYMSDELPLAQLAREIENIQIQSAVAMNIEIRLCGKCYAFEIFTIFILALYDIRCTPIVECIVYTLGNK